jgi:hypothetical protein
MKIKKPLILLELLLLAVLFNPQKIFAQAETAVRSGRWSTPARVTIPSAEGDLRGFTKKINLTRKRGSEQPQSFTVQIVAVPGKRLYWLGPENRLHFQFSFFVLDNRLVGVRGDLNDGLRFYASAEQMSSDDDQSAMEGSLEALLKNFYKYDLIYYKPSVIALDQYLGFFPFTAPTAAITPAPEVEGVSVGKSEFSVNVSGGQDNKVKAVVTFGSDFTVIRATLGGKQVYPQ